MTALVRAALELDWQGLVYSGGLENRPDLLRRLERRGVVWGNGSGAVAELRDPETFFNFLRRARVAHPATHTGGRRAPGGGPACLWKPFRSGGGAGVRPARARELTPRGFYRQARVRGTPGSVTFLSDGERSVLLGVTRQLSGFAPLGGTGYRYGGNIAGPPRRILPARALALLSGAVEAITRRFCLRGLNGLDFVLTRGGVPQVIEVNPRYTASMELLEELSGVNLFDAHLRALTSGRLPGGPLRVQRLLAKGVLYARRDVGWPRSLPERGLDVRDRPAAGEWIEAGHPICTLVVSAGSVSACRRRLAVAAREVRRGLCYDKPHTHHSSIPRHPASETGRPRRRSSP